MTKTTLFDQNTCFLGTQKYDPKNDLFRTFRTPQGPLKTPSGLSWRRPSIPFTGFDLQPWPFRSRRKPLQKPSKKWPLFYIKKHTKTQNYTFRYFYKKSKKSKIWLKMTFFSRFSVQKKSQIFTKWQKMNFIGISRPLFQVPKVQGSDFLGVLRKGLQDPSFFNFAPKPGDQNTCFCAHAHFTVCVFGTFFKTFLTFWPKMTKISSFSCWLLKPPSSDWFDSHFYQFLTPTRSIFDHFWSFLEPSKIMTPQTSWRPQTWKSSSKPHDLLQGSSK